MRACVNMGSLKRPEFSPDYLRKALADLDVSRAHSVAVALSGGVDSMALLHAMSQLGWPQLRAIHIDHGLQAEAAAWGLHAEAAARALGVACTVLRVEVRDRSAGPEAGARAARYGAFAEELAAGEVLLMGHHADDQMETVLLRLVQGAGLAGLGGIPPVRDVGAGRLVRPLLAMPRAALLRYAQERRLAFVQDPSNDDERFARNYVRRQLLPDITRRWPGAWKAVGRAARHAQVAAGVLAGYVAGDLARCVSPDGALSVPRFVALAPDVQPLVLRAWLQNYGAQPPSEAKCREVQAALALVPRSRRQVLRLGKAGTLYRYRDRVLWGAGAPGPALPAWQMAWPAPYRDLRLPDGRTMAAQAAVGAGVSVAALAERPLRVGSRVPGQRVWIPGRGHRALKKLLPELGLAPWERAAAVLVLDGEALVAVAGVWVCGSYRARPGDAGLVLTMRERERPNGEVVRSGTI